LNLCLDFNSQKLAEGSESYKSSRALILLSSSLI